MSAPTEFRTVQSGKNGIGHGGPFEKVFAYDGASSGKRDHLFIYRPTAGAVSIVKQDNSKFVPIYRVTKGGLGGFAFGFRFDRALAFDYDHSGKMDHIICYRPGSGACYIIRHDGQGSFTPVYPMPASPQPTADAGNGIGGWDMRWPWDRLMAFDYDHSGRLDYICIYRRVKKMFAILRNDGGNFVPVYRNDTSGIGGFEMGAENDYAFAIDWDKKGCQDHILFTRVHTPTFPVSACVIAHQGEQFVTVWKTGADDSVLGVNLHSSPLHAFVFDYESRGTVDHIGFWSAQFGFAWFIEGGAQMRVKYKQGKTGEGKKPTFVKGKGVGGWMEGFGTRMLAFDYEGTGRLDHILIYNVNTGLYWVVTRAQASGDIQARGDEEVGVEGNVPEWGAAPNTLGEWAPDTEGWPTQ